MNNDVPGGDAHDNKHGNDVSPHNIDVFQDFNSSQRCGPRDAVATY